tara:strand:- start:2469 stop:3035 length:567 start_codon:yes stop_codon:yes gene_type:complete
MNQSPLNKNRNDKFILVLNLPDVLKEINDNISRNNNRVNSNSLEMSVYGSLTPSTKINSINVPYGSQSIKVTSHAREAYEDITLDFKIDNEYRNYWVIYKWLDILNDVKTGIFNNDDIIPIRRHQSLKAYSSTFTIYGLDEYENRKIQFDYIGAFPTNLTEIKWSYGDSSEISSAATFSFTRMEAKLL